MRRSAAVVLVFAAVIACTPQRYGAQAASEPPAIRRQRRAQPFLAKIEPVLLQADTVELISLDPYRSSGDSDTTLAGRAQLGRTTLSSDDTRVLAAALRRSAERATGTGGCFMPRHAIVARRGATRLELLVCFQCWQARGTVDGERVFTALDDAEQEDFDRLLIAAHVPLAPKAPRAATEPAPADPKR